MTADRKLTRNTLQSQLADDLLKTLREGAFQPGDRVATEAQLMERHGVSRNTVRLAIKNLRDMGLVVSVPGKGIFAAPRASPPVIQERTGADPWDALTPTAEAHDERGAADQETAALLGIPYRDLIFIRHQAATSNATGQPVLTTRIIASVILEVTSPKVNYDSDRTTLVAIWTEQHGPLRTAHYVRAVLPPGDKWSALGIAQLTAAQEVIMLTETEKGLPLMLEMELSAAPVRAYFPAHPIPSAIGARD